MTTATWYATHLLALASLWLVAAGAGSLVAARAMSLTMRSIVGLAIWGHGLLVLALAGQLRRGPILSIAAVLVIGGALRLRGRPQIAPPSPFAIALTVFAAPWFLLALFPPLAFDETLYHLPFIDTFARTGTLGFISHMRFPVFPVLQELLCVPLFLFFGDTSTHLVALLQGVLTAALVFEWGSRVHRRAGTLAAALVLGSPLVLHNATITYNDTAVMLFCTAGLYALDRARHEGARWYAAAGLLLGTACAVKYLAVFFLVAALAAVVARHGNVLVFAGTAVAAALPTYARLVYWTGNPFFPFLSDIFGSSPWEFRVPAATLLERIARTITLPWNVTFGRAAVNLQPPVHPLVTLAALIVLLAAFRERRLRFAGVLIAGYLLAFAFLPQDSRFLQPIIPLAAAAAAGLIVPRLDTRPVARVALVLFALLPGAAYLAWRLARSGLPPADAIQRGAIQEARIPALDLLKHARPGRVYVCGAEQLKWFAVDDVIGDVFGPHAYPALLRSRDSASMHGYLQQRGVDWFLAAKPCVRLVPPLDDRFVLTRENEGARLWRVQSR